MTTSLGISRRELLGNLLQGASSKTSLPPRYTPIHDFYHPLRTTYPVIAAQHWRLTLVARGSHRQSLSLDDLLMLPASEIDATVCSPASSPGESRIATARWRGIWLRDVLHGLDEGVSVTSADGKTVDLSGAMANAAFLAYAMSGVRLDPKHGAPLKLIALGYDDRFMPGWVRRISVRDSTLSTFAIPQNAHAQAIILPPQQAYLGQPLSLQGYAYAGNAKIDQVHLSIHGGDPMPITFIQGEPGVWSRWGCVWQPTQLGIAQLTIEVMAGSEAASGSKSFQVHPIT